MKRIIIVLAPMLGAMSVAAQDTVYCPTDMPEGYLYDTNWSNVIKINYGFGPFAGPATGGENAKRFIVDDTVTIYGIAASVVPAPVYGSVYDASYTNSIEYLRVYRSQSDTLVPLAEVPVHMGTTPVSYYCRLEGCPENFAEWRKVAPMYERYFDTPVDVCGTFYAGMTFFIERPYVDSTGVRWSFAAPPLALNFIALPSGVGYEWSIVRHLHHDEYGGEYSVWGSGLDRQMYTMLFPILTPNDDTTTLGAEVTPGQLAERYTGLSPNPAAGTARVVSSFGLTRVEAYNAAGNKVYDRPAAGYSATIDVGRWPAGVYILHIHTPMGATMKKLTVTR